MSTKNGRDWIRSGSVVVTKFAWLSSSTTRPNATWFWLGSSFSFCARCERYKNACYRNKLAPCHPKKLQSVLISNLPRVFPPDSFKFDSFWKSSNSPFHKTCQIWTSSSSSYYSGSRLKFRPKRRPWFFLEYLNQQLSFSRRIFHHSIFHLVPHIKTLLGRNCQKMNSIISFNNQTHFQRKTTCLISSIKISIGSLLPLKGYPIITSPFLLLVLFSINQFCATVNGKHRRAAAPLV